MAAASNTRPTSLLPCSLSTALQTGLMTWTYSAMNLFWLDSKRLMCNQQVTMEQFIAVKWQILIVPKTDVYFDTSGTKVSVVSTSAENVSPIMLPLLFCKSIGDTVADTAKSIADTVSLFQDFSNANVAFYPRGASNARIIAIIVCLSVCLSHAGIVSKRLNLGSRKQHHVIAQGLQGL